VPGGTARHGAHGGDSATRPVKTRMMKARRSATVSGCGHRVTTGQQIVQRDGKWWCLPCALDAIGADVEGARRTVGYDGG
jgi:hypothetical protein